MLLSINSVPKRCGTTLAIDGISLEVDAGEFIGLLGPNGARFSTGDLANEIRY
jgi:ABC-2 type transport system ATP-binding protein